MRKLYLLALAAGAAVAPTAAAAAEGPPAGHSWREAVPAVGPAAPRAAEVVRQMHRRDGGEHRRGRFGHVQRIGRGGVVPGFWWGPQFVVRNFGSYGFPQPFVGGRWIRYYDDALLIDRYGRVHDGRYGYDWDRHGDRWGYDRRGVPVYVGDGDYEPDERDYEWAERWDQEGDRYAHRDGPMRDGCADPCTRTHHGPPPPAYGYNRGGYSYGYGHGCGCTVTETITTTTTAPVVEQVTTYEYVTEYVKQRAAPKKRKPVRRAPRPAPPSPGERG